MIYLKCRCGCINEYANEDDARAAGWTWPVPARWGSTHPLTDVLCPYCRHDHKHTFAIRRHTTKHGTTAYYIVRLSDNLPIATNGRPVAFVQAWSALVWARNNGYAPLEPMPNYEADMPTIAPEAAAAYPEEFDH